MTDLRQAAQQALEVLETLSKLGNGNSDGNSIGNTIAQEAREHLFTALAQPEQEPTPWRDMIVATLVREGIDKHKARELADHFAVQPEQEPVAFYHPHKGFHWAKPTHISAPTVVDVPPMPLYTAAQRPWQGMTEKDWEYVKNSKGTSLDTFDHGAAWAADQLMKRNT